MAGQVGEGLERSVEETAERLGVSADEVWMMINTGELSTEETVGGVWVVPAWSIDYLISARAREARTELEPPVPPPVPSPASQWAPEPSSKGEAKRLKRAKKWKRKFDELGRKKNGLERERRELLRIGDAAGSRRLPGLDRELRGVEAERERHEEEGLELGFLRREGAQDSRGRRGVVPHTEAIGLSKIGLRPGLRFSSELEMFNPPDSRGNPREKSAAVDEPGGAQGAAEAGRAEECEQEEQGDVP